MIFIESCTWVPKGSDELRCVAIELSAHSAGFVVDDKGKLGSDDADG